MNKCSDSKTKAQNGAQRRPHVARLPLRLDGANLSLPCGGIRVAPESDNHKETRHKAHKQKGKNKMPTIKRQAPLLPEGEYVAVAKRVALEWTKPRLLPNGKKSEPVQRFRIPLHLADGRTVTELVQVRDDMGWKFDSIMKSGGISAPEDGDFVLSPDDLENRRFYFGIEHEEWNGRTMVKVRFHGREYACGINPVLEGVTFPGEAPRGITLRSAKPQEPPPEAPEETAAPKPPAPTLPPAAADNAEKPEDLTDEEFRSALEYAHKLKEGKED
jgi:hypothetical protein